MTRDFFFAGGGTGGHIYPAIAVAERIARLEPTARVQFLCSGRPIDSQILDQADAEWIALPAEGFPARPGQVVGFVSSFRKSYRIARSRIARSSNPTVVAVGGFAAAPVALAARRLKVPLALINVDFVPGKANRLIARWAAAIFVQFDETRKAFARYPERVHVVGCPLRTGFHDPQPDRARRELGLDPSKKVLLVTGASSGAQNINAAICMLLPRLDRFLDDWQIVHLTGTTKLDSVRRGYEHAKIAHRLVGYYEHMADLYASSDLVIGRSGGVSVAEYAASGVPCICMPYPYHRDRHQYLNAGKLVEAGAAVIVDDVADPTDRGEWLWEELEDLLTHDERRSEMAGACSPAAPLEAADRIASHLLGRPMQASDKDGSDSPPAAQSAGATFSGLGA